MTGSCPESRPVPPSPPPSVSLVETLCVTVWTPNLVEKSGPVGVRLQFQQWDPVRSTGTTTPYSPWSQNRFTGI